MDKSREWRLIFYEKDNGDFPVVDFLNSLNPEMKIKMMQRLDFLETNGNIPKGDSTKLMGDGIFELRAQNKTDITRIFFFFGKNREIILTNAYVKKQNKTNPAELQLAAKSRADFLKRTEKVDVREFYYGNLKSKTAGPKWRPLYDVLSDAKQRSEHSLSGAQQQGKRRSDWCK